MEMILKIWREVAKQMDAARSLPQIAEMVGERFPIQTLLVRDLHLAERRLETRFASAYRGTRVPSDLHRELSEPELQVLFQRCFSKERVFHINHRADDSLAEIVVPQELDGNLLIGALLDERELLGYLVFAAANNKIFTEKHQMLFELLLEPVAAALSADRRMAELDRERRAYAADKDTLLSKLERQDISGSVVGADAGLKSVIEHVERVAPTDAPVLILGETGTGKEVIARTIHGKSRRADGPMFRVNCGAIPPELVDSELFGHERGAFTGAVSDRPGWFERADGGTLFLDEVGELPPAAQVRLLRVIQDQVLERVGGRHTVSVDVRIVAATNADLAKMAADGRFREDLWYRLAVFPIHLPPLRDRPGDIPALAAHFAWSAGKRLGGVPLVPSGPDLALLLTYSWPGNVRELAAVIERAAILGDGKTLAVSAALGRFQSPSSIAPPLPAAISEPIVKNEAFKTLDRAMADHIEAALARTEGRIEGRGGTADLLGINPHTLRARMRKLGIDWNQFRRRFIE